MADTVAEYVASLNADARSAKLDHVLLDAAIQAQSKAFQDALSVGHDYSFSDVSIFITPAQLLQMQEVIAAVARMVDSKGWGEHGEGFGRGEHPAKGVFFGYDFHLNAEGVHLIEINSNAGGGFLNALLLESQRDSNLPGRAVAVDDIEGSFLDMFRNEWRLECGGTPLKRIAITDDQPESQYLYPEFLLAEAMFKRAGIAACIADPAEFEVREDGLYLDGKSIDLVYNRLTDFSLQHYPALLQASTNGQIVLTPHPEVYARYADKRNLARLTDVQGLFAINVSETDIAVLQAGVPQTVVVRPEMEEMLWAERKQWFFKPSTGYGSKGAYRGANVTRKVFAEIMRGDYVAQRVAAPGERAVCVNNTDTVQLKYDVRCFVYDGKIQLVSARLYQGQTTNFRTLGGGFAMVRVVE